MILTRFGAFVLLLTSGLATGCASQLDGNNIDQSASVVMTKDEARTAVSNTHGSTTSVCTAIGYDSNSDGVNDVFAYVIGQDVDADLLAVIPTDWSDIYSTGQYGCVFDDLNGFIEIPTDADIGTDCIDTDATIGSAGIATYVDGDGDGDGAGSAAMVCSDLPTGYSLSNTDCDDANAAINPAATEICNDVDDDCDGLIDALDGSIDVDSMTVSYIDVDGDLYGDPDTAGMLACGIPVGYVEDLTDCDDTRSDVNPGMIEVCDGSSVDENCDGLINDADPTEIPPYLVFHDADGDHYGDPAVTMMVCESPDASWIGDNTDCNDTNAGINPAAADIPDNGIDEDCVGGDATTAPSNSDVCITGNSATVGSDTFELFAVDYTLDWWDLPTTGVSASGTICSTQVLVDGHEFKVNAEDSTHTYWMVMRSDATVPNHIESISVRGVTYNIGSVDPGDDVWTVTDGLTWELHPWSFTGVAPWDGRDLILIVPAE